MPIKAGYKYTDRQIPCELCGKKLRTVQGYSAHLVKVHGVPYVRQVPDEPSMPDSSSPFLSTVAVDSVSGDAGGNLGALGLGDRKAFRIPGTGETASTISEDPSIEVLEMQLKKLRLQNEIRRLADPPRQQPADVSESLGLGKLSPEISAGLQSRAFAMTPPPPPPDLTPIIVELIRAITDRPPPAPPPSNGNNGLGILKDLGIDLMSLITQRQASPGLKIGQLDLSGMPLDAAAVGSLIEYQTAIAASEGQKAMIIEGLQTASKYAPMVGKLLRGITLPAHPSPMEAPALIGQLVPCGSCNTPLKVTGDHNPGDQITCSECGAVWDIAWEGGEAVETASGSD